MISKEHHGSIRECPLLAGLSTDDGKKQMTENTNVANKSSWRITRENWLANCTRDTLLQCGA